MSITWPLGRGGEKRYDDVQAGWRDGKYQLDNRNLMIDGLMTQLLQTVDEA